MANITVGQIIMDAQKMASRVKDLDGLSSAIMVEADGNNRFVESLRQFQDDMNSLNRIVNNKSNAEMVNRIQQQNAQSSEILKENRELKVCVEDYERALELIMQKYREHTQSKILCSKLNFKEVYNEKLWMIIREQREKINEMSAVMRRVAAIDDERDLEDITRLRLENKTLRELLQISKQNESLTRPIRLNDHLFEEKAVQTELLDDLSDELSLSGASIENINNSSIIQVNSVSSGIGGSLGVSGASGLINPYLLMNNSNELSLSVNNNNNNNNNSNNYNSNNNSNNNAKDAALTNKSGKEILKESSTSAAVDSDISESRNSIENNNDCNRNNAET